MSWQLLCSLQGDQMTQTKTKTVSSCDVMQDNISSKLSNKSSVKSNKTNIYKSPKLHISDVQNKLSCICIQQEHEASTKRAESVDHFKPARSTRVNELTIDEINTTIYFFFLHSFV